jgi:hypothetical protein
MERLIMGITLTAPCVWCGALATQSVPDGPWTAFVCDWHAKAHYAHIVQPVTEYTTGTGYVYRLDHELSDGFVLREERVNADVTVWKLYRGAYIGSYKTRENALRRVERSKARDVRLALEHVARTTGESVESLSDRLIAHDWSEAQACRRGIVSGMITWPYPQDECPVGTVPWRTAVEDFKRAGMTEFITTTRFGVLWLNSE